MKSLIDQAKEYQFGTPGEVILPENPQSVCLSPWSTKTMEPLDPEVVAFAKEHNIEIRTMEQYEYACHEYDRVYDAGEV
jgi:hypothetical protein